MTPATGRTRPSDGTAVLRALPVLAGCSARTIRRLAHLGTRLPVEAGRRLTTAGTRGSEVVMILSGSATCLVDGVERARFGPGDFFGEVATLDGGPRTATVVAGTAMEVLVFNGSEFEELIGTAPEIAYRVLRAMAQRLRHANAASVA